MTDHQDLTRIIDDAGIAGVLARDVKPDTDDIICGYLDTKEPPFARRLLIALYEHHRSRQPFQVGDRVRVRPEYWSLGHGAGGWGGFAPMFADEFGTVTKVEWSISADEWSFLVEYENSYRFSEYGEGRFWVHDRPSSFSMWPEYLWPDPGPRL